MFRAHGRDRGRGQALVEFSLVLIPFLIILMGVYDLGRAIYMMNGTAEAAREIARVTVVHPFGATKDLGTSAQTTAVITTQRGLVPNLSITPSTDIVCVDPTDTVQPDSECFARPDRFVRVHVRTAFEPITPIVAMFGSHDLESYSRIDVP